MIESRLRFSASFSFLSHTQDEESVEYAQEHISPLISNPLCPAVDAVICVRAIEWQLNDTCFAIACRVDTKRRRFVLKCENSVDAIDFDRTKRLQDTFASLAYDHQEKCRQLSNPLLLNQRRRLANTTNEDLLSAYSACRLTTLWVRVISRLRIAILHFDIDFKVATMAV